MRLLLFFIYQLINNFNLFNLRSKSAAAAFYLCVEYIYIEYR